MGMSRVNIGLTLMSGRRETGNCSAAKRRERLPPAADAGVLLLQCLRTGGKRDTCDVTSSRSRFVLTLDARNDDVVVAWLTVTSHKGLCLMRVDVEVKGEWQRGQSLMVAQPGYIRR